MYRAVKFSASPSFAIKAILAMSSSVTNEGDISIVTLKRRFNPSLIAGFPSTYMNAEVDSSSGTGVVGQFIAIVGLLYSYCGSPSKYTVCQGMMTIPTKINVAVIIPTKTCLLFGKTDLSLFLHFKSFDRYCAIKTSQIGINIDDSTLPLLCSFRSKSQE